MKTVDLLKPRYKVIADYPETPYTIGEIYEGDTFYNGSKETRCEHENYPAIFKKLEWWEDRELEDMRTIKYVSYISLTKKDKIYGKKKTSTDNFYKARVFHEVTKWELRYDRFDMKKEKTWKYQGTTNEYWYELFHSSLPHTEQEHIDFYNTQKQTSLK